MKEVATSAASYLLAFSASYILASNIDQPFTNITASGNISASGVGTIGGGQLTVNGDMILDTSGIFMNSNDKYYLSTGTVGPTEILHLGNGDFPIKALSSITAFQVM